MNGRTDATGGEREEGRTYESMIYGRTGASDGNARQRSLSSSVSSLEV